MWSSLLRYRLPRFISQRRSSFPVCGSGIVLCLVICLPWLSHAAEKRIRWDRKKWGPVISHKNFPKECGLCHAAKNWGVLREDFKFDHKKETGFLLEGAHAFANCIRCHNDRGPVKAYNDRGCGGCHVDPHRGSMGLDCMKCHDQNSWRVQGAIAAHARTPFPLSGRHLALQCEACHSRAAAGDYRGTPSECYACHQAAYQTAPSHVAMNFATTCWKCHTTASFTGARFDHSTLGPNPNCYACHSADYQRAPNHVSQNFPTTCGQCHNTSTWAGARFNHSGFTAATACTACHQADYNAAPNHSTVGFPLLCGTCHGIGTTWSGAALNHPFPQNHRGSSCMQCHVPGPPITYQCYGCHHTQDGINTSHAGRPGFVPNPTPQQCVACHPTGSGN